MAKKKVEGIADTAVVEKIDPEKEVEVNLNEHNEPIKPEVKKIEEPRYVTAEQLQETQRKANAAFFAEQRKIQSMLERLEAGLKPKEIVRETPPDEWDEKVQKNWKGTVEELADARAEAKFKALREAEKAQEALEREQRETTDLLGKNKIAVMQRHPELDDPTSEKAQVFQSVITRNPSYLTNPYGPVLAMRDMEDELRSQGKFVDEPTKRAVETEVQRLARTNGTGIPKGNGSASANKVVLTKEERQYCDDHKIKYESFASTKQKLSTQREIEA